MTPKKNKVKKIKAFAKIPDASCLNEPLQIYSTKEEAERAVNDLDVRLYGLECLYQDFISFSKVVPVEIIIKK